MRLSRYLITCLLGALSLLPLTAGAADLLARADMRMPTPDALTPERLDEILGELAAGKQPKTGTQIEGKRTSEPEGGPTTLKEMVDANHDYRKEW